MEIPSKFRLFGTTIKVIYADKILEETGALGDFNLSSATIRLRRPSKDVPKDMVEHTFCHELVHAMFQMMGREELGKDEELADTLGGLLHQFLVAGKDDGN